MRRVVITVAGLLALSLTAPVHAQDAAPEAPVEAEAPAVQPPPPPPKPKSLEELLALVQRGWREERQPSNHRPLEKRSGRSWFGTS